MASDLLTTIRGELDARLRELRPLFEEYERLVAAANLLDSPDGAAAVRAVVEGTGAASELSARRRGDRGGRGAAAGAPKAAKAAQTTGATDDGGTRKRAQRGAAREAILAALEHGSHTASELVVVTAMSAPNITGNLRRLLQERAVVKTRREGKTAYELARA
jgi:DNA-binding transcriptional ArsR family regulator